MRGVDFESSVWSKEKRALEHLDDLYSGWFGNNPFDKANKALRKAQNAANGGKDPDGWVSVAGTEVDESTARSDIDALWAFANGVESRIHDQIDRPFYEKLDKFVQGMRNLNLNNYETPNLVPGVFMRTQQYGYGPSAHTQEVDKEKIRFSDLMGANNYYSNAMKEMYEAWSKENPDAQLSQKDFVNAYNHQGAFEYRSIEDDQLRLEMIVDIVAAVAIIGVTIICPPAGFSLGLIYGSYQVASGIGGQDFASGRQLSGSERGLRVVFGLLDAIPAAKGLSLASEAAQQAGEGMFKLGFKEGLENLDNFSATLAKNTNSLKMHANDVFKRIRSNLDALKSQTGNTFQSLGDDLIDVLEGPSMQLAMEGVPNAQVCKFITGGADELTESTMKIASAVDGEAVKLVDEVVESGIQPYDEFLDALKEITTKPNISNEDKISELKKLLERSKYKTDINIPSDVQYIKFIDEKGRIIYDWPKKLGFNDKTVVSITRTDGLPKNWDRYGYMGGSNFSDIPNSGKYSYSERAIPYVENEAAYHFGTFNNESYFDKIDAICEGELDLLNDILLSEGIDSVDSAYFQNIKDAYLDFIDDTTDIMGTSVDATYGLKGTAAKWGDMSGGAGQFVTPLNGLMMKRLGMLN